VWLAVTIGDIQFYDQVFEIVRRRLQNQVEIEKGEALFERFAQ
jgi:hypothetical protein